MAVRTLQFYRHQRGHGDTHLYFLAVDDDNRRVFIIHTWEYAAGGDGEAEIDLPNFLAGGGDRQNALLDLIAGLVPQKRTT